MATSSRHIKEIAVALVDVAVHEKAVADVLLSVQHVQDAFASERGLLIAFSDQAAPVEKRRDALRNALKGQIDPQVLNSLLLLQDASLLDQLDAWAAAVVAAAADRANHRRAIVTSAVDLTADERHELEASLIKKFGGTIELTLRTDPSLVGGFVVDVDGWRFDGSIVGTCKRLAGALATP